MYMYVLAQVRQHQSSPALGPSISKHERFSRRRKGPTVGGSRLGSRRAAPLPIAIVAAPEAEAAATPEPQPAKGSTCHEEHTPWQTLRCIIKRRQLYVKNHLAHRQGFRVGCAKCDEELLVALPEASSSNLELFERPSALMLACGHLFCYKCLERARDKDHFEGRAMACPVCEAAMECLECGHLARWEPIPRIFYGPEGVDEVPLTTPEGGASPSKCASCMASEAWTAQGEEEVVRLLRDEEREDLCDAVNGEVRRVLCLVMNDMEEEEEYVEMDADDVRWRLWDLAGKNMPTLWDRRRDYVARWEGVINVDAVDNMEAVNTTGVVSNMGVVNNMGVVSNMGVMNNMGVVSNMGIVDNTGIVNNTEVMNNTEVINDMEVASYMGVMNNMEVVNDMGAVNNMGTINNMEVLNSTGAVNNMEVVGYMGVMNTMEAVNSMGAVNTIEAANTMGAVNNMEVVNYMGVMNTGVMNDMEVVNTVGVVNTMEVMNHMMNNMELLPYETETVGGSHDAMPAEWSGSESFTELLGDLAWDGTDSMQMMGET
ncbi:uncharacterized protein TRIREDRAFT_110762 [Trichoderma reesei QM6a]|uniref:Predicted protein n=1 Tax=Hypocrea jecorina (strain QM6a) TaxID=431241 RepID=G0RSV7_HYPJQ|nr:uncharacterized protein TRIREDRAFT_110762 [Trichoderma reesei QM6a]EGR45751.1 predicted protein [Trichoderma reesei QM6a]